MDVHAASLLLRTPSPILLHLEIWAYRGLVHLPDDFLGRHAPSLRSVSFDGVHPRFEPDFPLPSLIEFKLSLPEIAHPFCAGALFKFLSGCPHLQKIRINSKVPSQDIPLDTIIPLESLVELDYTYSPVSQVLPCLRLPHLKRLRASFSLGQAQNVVDILPHGSHAFLAGATKILYHSYEFSQEIRLYGRGTDVSFTVFRPETNHATADWFPDAACIFGQIEELIVEGSIAVGFPINIAAFENLRALQITPWNVEYTEEFLRLFWPDPRAGVPCPSLQEIRYPCWGPLEPLMGVVRERKRGGHQLGLVRLLDTWGGTDQDLAGELEEHVGKVRVEKWYGVM